MKLAWLFAWRYLVGKKSTQAIHIISVIAVTGVAIGTAALIIVLSIFNGFETLIAGLINRFNPDIRITAVEGKTFTMDTVGLADFPGWGKIKGVSQTMEETALFEYDGVRDFGVIKGVDSQFAEVTDIELAVTDGAFVVEDSLAFYAVLGGGMRSKLGVSVKDLITQVYVYLPNRLARTPLDEPFKRRGLYPAGIFQVEQEIDYTYVFTSLDFVRDMMALDDQVGALELSLHDPSQAEQVMKELQAYLGPTYEVKDRYGQQEAFLRLMNMEKLVSFGILSFILVIVSFNLIGSLWMIALEKEHDVAVLKAMGATDSFIGSIFRKEGFLLVGGGLMIGMILGIGFYFLQVHYGIIRIPDGFLVQSYPIELRVLDFLLVVAVVMGIGWLSGYFPTKRAMSTPAYIREE
jgi:lipoprotein-releasing system permease protein